MKIENNGPVEVDSIAWELLDAKAIAITIMDLDGKILSINKKASQQIDKPIAEIIGSTIWNFIPDAYLNHYKILVNQVFETQMIISISVMKLVGF